MGLDMRRRTIFILFSLWLLSISFVLSGNSDAHKLKYPRVVHIILNEGRVEFYFNCELPQTPQAELYYSIFDFDRNGKLDRRELLKLGRYLALKWCRPGKLSLDGMPIKYSLKEVEISKLRGNPRKKRPAWDIWFSGNISPQLVQSMNAKGKHLLSVQIYRLALGEIVPIALINLSRRFSLLPSKTSYVIQRKGREEAICRTDFKRDTCHFIWRVE